MGKVILTVGILIGALVIIGLVNHFLFDFDCRMTLAEYDESFESWQEDIAYQKARVDASLSSIYRDYFDYSDF